MKMKRLRATTICASSVATFVVTFGIQALTAVPVPASGIAVVPGDDAVDRLAAKEFTRYWKAMGGDAEVAERRPAHGPCALIGAKWAKDKTFDAKLDSYRIFSVVDDGCTNVVLAGGNARATMYATYRFFELQGCRWFWDGDVIPKDRTPTLAGFDVYDVSQFEWRATRYFAHRGLRRFSAEMWGPDNWKREIDWLLKNRLNLFFFRVGMDDLFQKAFPQYCTYPDASKPLPGQGKGYDNRSLFWSLEYRGALRKTITDYAFARGLMIPPDFGTITHWYTRTPQDFLDNAKPDFLPESTKVYSAMDTGKVWDVRQDKWLEAYWQLTEAEIAHYGQKPGPLHTIGFSERNLYTNRADNMALKVAMTKRTFERALKAYPDATILFAGWDFYATWTPEELKAYWPTLDWKHVVIFDYEANAYSKKKPNGTFADFTEWDIVGKYPYTFGTFFYEPSSMIHTDYDLIARRRKAVEGDPMCKGNILWPEASHTDILELRHFAENAWRFSNRSIDEILSDFCRERYGAQAAAFESIWKRVIPLSVKAAVYGPWGATYGKFLIDRLAGYPRYVNEKLNKRVFMQPRVPMSEFADAAALFADLAKIDWQGDFVRRDALDLARTLGDRIMLSLLCETQNAYLDWTESLRDDTDAILADADRAIALGELMARTLALHEDFSLWETFERTDAIERIRLPDFDKVLIQNAMNNYCASHQAEAAEHLYLPMIRGWRDVLARKFASGDRRANMNPDPLWVVLDAVWKRDLKSMRPIAPRTPAAFRQTMRDWVSALQANGPRVAREGK